MSISAEHLTWQVGKKSSLMTFPGGIAGRNGGITGAKWLRQILPASSSGWPA